MARRRLNTTKLEIIKVATEMFIEKGYSNTSIRTIADELGLSAGHVTFYFPTKEHLLVLLVEMLTKYQWKLLRQSLDEGKTSLYAICLELATMSWVCESNAVARDFYFSAYTSPMTLEVIRKNDRERSKSVFAEYCSDWKEEHYAEAEVLVSGIEYATLMNSCDSVSSDTKIAGALNCILSIYNVPKDVRKKKIDKILSLDYKTIGNEMLQEFVNYVQMINEQAFNEKFARETEMSCSE